MRLRRLDIRCCCEGGERWNPAYRVQAMRTCGEFRQRELMWSFGRCGDHFTNGFLSCSFREIPRECCCFLICNRERAGDLGSRAFPRASSMCLCACAVQRPRRLALAAHIGGAGCFPKQHQVDGKIKLLHFLLCIREHVVFVTSIFFCFLVGRDGV